MLSVDRFGNDLLRPAITVHLRSVNQAHAKLDSQTQRRDFSGTSALGFAHAPRALPEQRNALAVRECDGSHLNSTAFGKRESGRNFSPRRLSHPRRSVTNGPTEYLAENLCSLLTLSMEPAGPFL